MSADSSVPGAEPTARIVPLGSGAMSRLGVPPKAALLDRAARAGLPVPAGFAITDGGLNGAAVNSALAGLGYVSLTGFAVRSAFGAEDGSARSLAGWFDSELRVGRSDVVESVGRVRASADVRDGEFRTDVLVMTMVDARDSGVAFTEPGTYDDLVNTVDGTAERLVAGEVAGTAAKLPRIETADEGWPRRLQRLLADVRDEFGDEPWDVEWADDGERCWLVQIRPITAAPRRDEVLTLANHAEILPDLPSALMTSIVAEAGPDLFAWYRRHDRSLPADRDFLQVMAGRPLINLSLLEDMMRHLGLPTGLVADSIGGDTIERRPINLTRILRKLPVLLRLGWSQLRATARSSAIRRRLVDDAERPTASFTEAVDRLHDVYVSLVTGMFPLSSAIGPPLSVLRGLGVLEQHAGRHRTVTRDLADALTSLGGDPSDAEIEAFLDEYGHRGVYESDIARPRYRDDLATLRSIAGARTMPAPPRRTLVGVLATPIWLAAKGPITARELLRHDAMRAFEAVRSELVRHAHRAVDDRRLPSVDALWLLEADEVRALDDGWTPDDEFWAVRRARQEELAAIPMPMTVSSGDDPRSWARAGSDSDRLHGLPLTRGRVEGVAWVLDEPGDVADKPSQDEPVVLVARSIDAGWIATMSHCDAVVVEIGGDLSHGSILVRELGLPAATNVAGVRGAVRTGDRIVVDAGAGIVDLAGGDA